MLYYLFQYLDKLNIPGAGLFEYISFRSASAVITSLIISMIIGKSVIRWLQRMQLGEVVRDLGLEGQYKKEGTPTMGGIIILSSILIPVLLFADILNVYVILMLVTTVWLGGIGLLDDYIKVIKKNKEGLAGKFKIVGQVTLGLFVGIVLYTSDQVYVRKKVPVEPVRNVSAVAPGSVTRPKKEFVYKNIKEPVTTIPFIKNHEFNYNWLAGFAKKNKKFWGWLAFVLITIFIITAVSNGANLTDGLDGLATGVSAIIGTTLGILAYVSGNMLFADYLNIMFIPNSGELVIFASAFIGATVGFLWYNAYPAQVFMGDTGSLALGGIIAVFSIIIRKELLIPVLCGIFLVENLSVIMQVSYFKYTRKKFGQGRRIFLMSPLHHHFQMKGFTEPKIVTRFWIVAIMLAVITVVTLKIR
jgi:phospho-N-acetylmuramoyl-pentapeptide-transferase